MQRDPGHVAAGLGRELGPLRRAVSRAVRARQGLPDLTDNQVEVLRAVTGEPGLNTVALASRLQLARPTVSNLLNSMRRAGLVELRRRDDDARAVEVHATDEASALLEAFDAVSERVIAEALGRLDDRDVRAVELALPALARLNAVLAAASPGTGPLREKGPAPGVGTVSAPPSR